jgi:mediator of RNA polymerase II transcription subunit 12
MRYAAIRTVRFPERELLLSLQSLATAVQSDSQLLQLLSYDLSRLDQKNSMAACSPASDNMGEVMQHTATYSDDEIERVLSSGTSMDQQMMARVLRKIVCNLEEHTNKGYLQLESHPAWFWRLRSFDEPTFDGVLHDWLASSLVNSQIRTLRVAVPPLVSSGCMTLSNFLSILRAYIAKSKGAQFTEPSLVAMDGLRILLHSDAIVESCLPQDAYRYRLEQHKLCFASDARIVDCIRDVAELVHSASSTEVGQMLSDLLATASVAAILRQQISSGVDFKPRIKTEQQGWVGASNHFQSVLSKLLDPLGTYGKCCSQDDVSRSLLTKCLGVQHASSTDQVTAVFKIASELSLPICQVLIEHIFSDPTLEGELADALSATLLSAVKTAVEEDRSQGLELLAALDSSLTNKVSVGRITQESGLLTSSDSPSC